MIKPIYNKVREYLIPTKQVSIGDIGIFLDRGKFSTDSDDNFSITSEIYYKVKVVGVYEDLVEVDVMHVHSTTRTNGCIKSLIENHTVKYLKISKILWESRQQ